MGLHYAMGALVNIVGRGPAAVTNTGTVNPLFPLANLYSGSPRKPMAWSSFTANSRIIVDTNLVSDPSFEVTSPSAIPNWLDVDAGTGVSQQSSAVTPPTGTFSLLLEAGASGSAQRIQSVTVRAGERLRLRAKIRQNGAGTGGVALKDNSTGKQLNPSGAWVAAGTTLLSAVKTTADTAGAFVALSQDFQIESPEAHGGDYLTQLLVVPYNGDQVNDPDVYIDDVELLPAINFLGGFSHNWRPNVTPKWRSDDDSAFGSPTTNATFTTIPRTDLYSLLTIPVYERYHDVLIEGFPIFGSPPETPRLGELVLAFAETLVADHTWGYGRSFSREQQRVVTPEGDVHLVQRSRRPRKDAQWTFAPQVETEVEEIIREMLDRSEGGEIPGVIVDTIENDAYHCRLPGQYTVQRVFLEQWALLLSVIGSPPTEWIDG